MIIDKSYILDRFGQLFAARLKAEADIDEQFTTIYQLKSGFPKWMHGLFHPLNPLYFIWKRGYMLRRYLRLGRLRKTLTDRSMDDFVPYCFGQEGYALDTSDFAGTDDELQLVTYLDNRLGMAIGAPFRQMTQPEAGFAEFQRRIKTQGNYCRLPLDGREWKLPECSGAYAAYTHYGLDLLPDRIASYIAGKDFVDCGAYVGDSAIYLLKYRPRKIYAFEPVSTIYSRLEWTIRANGLETILVPVKKGLGDSAVDAIIHVDGDASRIGGDTRKAQKERIAISTLDQECRTMKVGLIKMDVEGFEYNVVKGGLATIERDRPVMLISIYHTWKDFFEILPMIRALEVGYRFQFIDLYPGHTSEKILAAYPV